MYQISKKAGVLAALCLSVFMISSPKTAIEAASHGFMLWSNMILPALFPFFVAAELCLSLGMVNFLGVLLEPIMRPLFRLPGTSSLIVAMGFSSGFPVGAILTKKFYDEKLLSLSEAEHLLSFTNNSSPLFILGAIGVGLLQDMNAGVTLAAAHYLANFLVGLIGRYTHAKAENNVKEAVSFKRAYQSLHQYQIENPENIGAILGRAVRQGLVNTAVISGFIMLFSVISSMCISWGWLHGLAVILQKICGLSLAVSEATLKGLFEMTLGAEALAAAEAPILAKLILIGCILGFGGLSVNAQIISIMSSLPIRWSRYFLRRFLQMILSSILIFFLYPLQQRTLSALQPAFSSPPPQFMPADSWSFALISFSLCLLLLIGLSLCALLKNPAK